jgi:translocation protein SEC63
LDVVDKDRLLELDDPTRRKVLALLWAHLGRVDLGDETLNKGSYRSSHDVANEWQRNSPLLQLPGS